jgi:uncharacterized membrane-anchored protein
VRFNSRRAHFDDMPGLIGVARVSPRASHLVGRVRRGDIVVIDQPDLDQETAIRLVDRGVVAVVNACPMVSGRFANLGPAVLSRAGVAMVDSVGRGGWSAVPDGRSIRIYDGVIHVGHQAVAHGRAVTGEDLRLEMEQARSGLTAQLDTLVHNTGEFLRREQQLLLDGYGLPELSTDVAGRPAIVVAGCDPRELGSLRRLVRDRDPAVFAVGQAADDLLSFGWVADVVVIPVSEADDSRSSDALRAAKDVVLVAPPGASEREIDATVWIERLGITPLRVETTATAEDVALLLAERHGAIPVVGVGLRTRLEDFLDRREAGLASTFATRLKVGSRLVDASVVPELESGGTSNGQVFALLLIGIAAVLTAVAVTPAGQEWLEIITDTIGSLT